MSQNLQYFNKGMYTFYIERSTKPKDTIKIALEYANTKSTQSDLMKKYRKNKRQIRQCIHWFLQNIHKLNDYTEEELKDICRRIYNKATNSNEIIQQAYDFSLYIRKNHPHKEALYRLKTNSNYKERVFLDNQARLTIIEKLIKGYTRKDISSSYNISITTIQEIIKEFVLHCFESEKYSLQKLDSMCTDLKDSTLSLCYNNYKIEELYDDCIKKREENKAIYFCRKKVIFNNPEYYSIHDKYMFDLLKNKKRKHIIREVMESTNDDLYLYPLNTIVTYIWFICNVIESVNYTLEELDTKVLSLTDSLANYFNIDHTNTFFSTIFNMRNTNIYSKKCEDALKKILDSKDLEKIELAAEELKKMI